MFAQIIPEAMIPLPSSKDERVLFGLLGKIARETGAPAELLEVKSGERAFGVEYRVVTDQGWTYLSALNLMKTAQTVRLSGIIPKQVTDLLSGNRVDCANIRLDPMVPVLLDLGKNAGKF